MEETPAVYSHNPYQEDGFPLLVLDVNRRHCVPFNEGFRVLHWHDEIQLVYLLEGEIYARVYGEMIQASQGDCLFLNRGVLHHITEKKNCRYHSYLIPPKMLGFFSGSVMEQEDVERILNQPQLIHRLFSAKMDNALLFWSRCSSWTDCIFHRKSQTIQNIDFLLRWCRFG